MEPHYRYLIDMVENVKDVSRYVFEDSAIYPILIVFSPWNAGG